MLLGECAPNLHERVGLPLDERDVFARGVFEQGVARVVRVRLDVVEHLPPRADDGAVDDGRAEGRERELERLGWRGWVGQRAEDGRRWRRPVGLFGFCPAAEGIEHGRIAVESNFGRLYELASRQSPDENEI